MTTKALIDTNIFLEILLDQAEAENCSEFLKNVEDGNIEAIVIDFTVDSIVIILEHRKKTPQQIRLFLASLLDYNGLELYSPTLLDRFKATILMEDHQIDYDDAIIYQSAKSLLIETIITYDKHFNNLPGIISLKPKDLEI